MLSLSKEKMRLTAEIIRKGGTILSEPCKVCGGIQVRFRDRVFCMAHEDVEKVLEEAELTVEKIKSGLKEILLLKIKEISTLLSEEKKIDEQERYVSLLIQYFELLKTVTEK
jgi:uncharacterized Zn finger protein (UPF0148 family)